MLQETKKCMIGIPTTPSVSSKFKSPFCEKAKMLKLGGNIKSQDVLIQRQVFHMDLSFVIGPSNLENMISSNAPPNETIKCSPDRYIGSLMIINLATKKLLDLLCQIKRYSPCFYWSIP